jgi:SAM-dependent methyltransferase
MIIPDRIPLSRKPKVSELMDRHASRRDRYIRRNRYYYRDLVNFLLFHVPKASRVLEIGCGTGFLLNSVNPRRGVGIDVSGRMVEIARQNFPAFTFLQMDGENLEIEEKFDYIVMSDTIGYFEDIQSQFSNLHHVCSPDSRVIITYLNFLWSPLLRIAELLRLKMPSGNISWLNIKDIKNLFHLAGFETVKTGRRFLCPVFVPVLSWLLNKFVAPLPVFNRLCLVNFVIARQMPAVDAERQEAKVSVIVPARNEEGNIEEVVKRIPEMGTATEIIFVEGGSTDRTREEIIRVSEQYEASRDVKWVTQDGKGKGDAVRKGFGMASGDILMVLDADLSMAPEDLEKFFRLIAGRGGELVAGSRLVYPLEKDSMRTLNLIGNRFFSIMFSWILGQRIKDTLCGTKAISKRNWQRIQQDRGYFGEFDPFGDFDLIFGAAKLDLKILEIPIRYRARQYGVSNISRLGHGWLLFKMMIFAMRKIKFH